MIDGMWASMLLTLKRAGFSQQELRRMTLPAAAMWMRAIETEREAAQGSR